MAEAMNLKEKRAANRNSNGHDIEKQMLSEVLIRSGIALYV